MFLVQKAYRPVPGNNQQLPKKISFRLKLCRGVEWSLIGQGLKRPRYIHWYLCTGHFWIHIRRDMCHIWNYLQCWHRLQKLISWIKLDFFINGPNKDGYKSPDDPWPLQLWPPTVMVPPETESQSRNPTSQMMALSLSHLYRSHSPFHGYIICPLMSSGDLRWLLMTSKWPLVT